MLSLLLGSEAHAKALITFLKTAHVPQETSVNQFKDCVASLTADNGLGFSDADLFTVGIGKQPLIFQTVTYLVTRGIDHLDPKTWLIFWSLTNPNGD